MNKKYLIGALSAAALGYSVVPTYICKLRQRLHRSMGGRTLYLTFDDGPDPRYTPELLDLLAEYNIKASFFVVAQSAQRNPAIIARMKREGHAICLHSLCHKNGMLQPPVSAWRDFEQAVTTMQKLGVPVRYFRPPWGHWNVISLTQLHRYGMTPVLWDVMAQDWRGDLSVKTIEERLLRRTTGGDIICLHDGRGENGAPARTIAALRRTLPRWISEGYRFETVMHDET
ncbi:MAG: polysaccharide deacetylase family protein [Eubacteriales bacterium]|nr:polysaccharide deacetylase family protein [Eubacteriales bacterium]